MDSTYLREFYADVLTVRAYIFGIGFGAALLLGASRVSIYLFGSDRQHLHRPTNPNPNPRPVLALQVSSGRGSYAPRG